MLTSFLWNLVLAGLMGLTLGIACRWRCLQVRPAARHILWLLVLAKLVTPPLVPVPILPGRDPNALPAASLATSVTPPIKGSPAGILPPPPEGAPIGNALSGPELESSARLDSTQLTFVGAPAPRGTSLVFIVVACSFCGSLVLIVRDVRRMLRMRWLLRRAGPGGDRLERLTDRAARRMGLARTPQVRIVDGRLPPFVFAGRRPIVVFPRALADALDDRKLDCIIAHELAHYRRRDHWANGFVFLVASLFWWHPVVWWARREIRAAQELCCDAIVINGHIETRRCYAESLLHVLEYVAPAEIELPVLASGFGAHSSLLRRFEMITDPGLNHRLPRWSYALLAAAVGIVVSVPARRPVLTAQEVPPPAINRAPPAIDQDFEIVNQSWRLLHLIHPAHRQGIWHLAFSPDGKQIASAAADKKTRLWEVATGRHLLTIERPVNCTCVAFSPDGRKLAISGGDHGVDPPGELVLWNLAAGEVEKVLLDHATTKYIRWTAFSPDGKRLAAGGTDKTVTIWNVSQGKLERTLRGHAGLIASVAFSPDGTRLASGSFDHTIKLWDTATGELQATLEGHEAEVRAVAFAPEAPLLLSTSDDKTARFWNTETYEQVTVMDGHDDGFVLCGAFSPDGSEVATAGKTGGGGHRVLLRSVPSGDWGDMGLFPAQVAHIDSVAFSPAGDMLAIAGSFNDFQIWVRQRSGR
jgi:beta-lactamase regulating signal transducer with metallopeptidase domain